MMKVEPAKIFSECLKVPNATAGWCFRLTVNFTRENPTRVVSPKQAASSNICVTMDCWIIYGIILPIVCSISLISSGLALSLLRKMERSSINICFICLFCAETVKVLIAMLVFCPFAHCDATYRFCSLLAKVTVLLYPLAMWCYLASVLVCVIITVDRYLVVSQPFRVYYFTKGRTVKMLAMAAVVALLYAGPTALEFHYSSGCSCFVKTALRESQVYRWVYYFAFRSCLAFVGIFALLFFLNCLITKTIFAKRRCVSSERLSQRYRRNVRVTMSCTAVIFAFLLSNLVPGIGDIMETVAPRRLLVTRQFKLMIYLGNVLVAVGPTINSAVYCGLGASFRRAMRRDDSEKTPNTNHNSRKSKLFALQQDPPSQVSTGDVTITDTPKHLQMKRLDRRAPEVNFACL